jgi:hypothetical protein
MEVITMLTTDPDTHGGIPPSALEHTGRKCSTEPPEFTYDPKITLSETAPGMGICL